MSSLGEEMPTVLRDVPGLLLAVKNLAPDPIRLMQRFQMNHNGFGTNAHLGRDPLGARPERVG